VHVLVLNHYAVPVSEGGLTRHIELFEQLDDSWSFQITAANRNSQTRQPHKTTHPNFKYLSIPAYDERNGSSRILGWLVFAVKAVLFGLSSKKPDVVYASSPHLLTAVSGLIVARLRRAKCIVEIRDLWPESVVEFGYLTRGSALHRFLSWLERFLYRKADHIVIVTSGWLDYFEGLGIPRDKISVITNGADISKWDPVPGAETIADRLGVSGPVAVYAGAHGAPNGLDHILNAAAKLPHVTFSLFGDGVAKATLMARAESEGLSNVIFSEPVPKTELASFLWTADIAIHTLADIELFKKGMSPNKLYDYMAAGLPVVTNAGGTAEEIIEESTGGVAVGPDDVALGVQTLLGLTSEQRHSMGARGRTWIDANASRASMANKLARTLSQTQAGGASA
jgi:glycosyltransferase involved in cell wall biosynthesis